MKISIPDPSLVVLIGPSGAGKSTFAQRHFAPTEILSSDRFRGLICDDENSMEATSDAFEALHFLLEKRLKNRRMTVVDATNVQSHARDELLRIARRHDLLSVAIVFDLPQRVCQERNDARPDRDMGPHVIRRHLADMRRGFKDIRRKFKQVFVLNSEAEVNAVEVERRPLFSDHRDMTGPFDIIGDIHGCYDELRELVQELGYQVELNDTDPWEAPAYGYKNITHPEGRTLFFVGDFCDRGPATPEVFRFAMAAVNAFGARAVPGNHDVKLANALRGKRVKTAHGLALSLEQLAEVPESFKQDIIEWVDSLVSHQVLDSGRLCVAHAGMREDYQMRASGRVRTFALYGDTTGEVDDLGMPVRLDWAAEYEGKALVVFGHTAMARPRWMNNSVCIDTGCVFGGSLSALKYPEREIISVPAKQVWAEPVRPLGQPMNPEDDGVLDIERFSGRIGIETSLMNRVSIAAENTNAAMEVMSRFAIDPRWLVYLPPTMSPCKTSETELLEAPREAFDEFESWGVKTVICQEKHMGSRAVLVLCRTLEVSKERFDGINLGVIYTRSGRPFFERDLEARLVKRVVDALENSGIWDELGAKVLVLDAELMPWSAKAVELIRGQYARVGAAAEASLKSALEAVKAAIARGIDPGVQPQLERRIEDVEKYRRAYRAYTWAINSDDDYRIAAFHFLASDTQVFTNNDHLWHMAMAEKLASTQDPVLMATQWRSVDLDNPESRTEAESWWKSMTGAGGEGMVVKPLDFVHLQAGKVQQPAIKVRGPEYLRIIYGPAYLEEGNLNRLRKRGLGRKRGLALREFALGMEGLERFARGDSLVRVHECAFGVLALESEPVDPRL